MIDETESDSQEEGSEENPLTTQDQGSESPGSEAADSPVPASESAEAPLDDEEKELLDKEEEPEQPAEDTPTLLGKVEALHKLIQDGEMTDPQAAALYKKVTVALDYAKIVTATE